VWLGALDDRECQVRQQKVIIINECQVDCQTLWDSKSGKALRDPGTVRLVGDLLANRGQLVLAVGLLDMGQECGTLAPQGDATAYESTGGTPLGRVNLGLGQPAAAP